MNGCASVAVRQEDLCLPGRRIPRPVAVALSLRLAGTEDASRESRRCTEVTNPEENGRPVDGRPAGRGPEGDLTGGPIHRRLTR